MTLPVTDIERVAELIGAGVSQAETARRTGIPRGTLRVWIKLGLDEAIEQRRQRTVLCGPGSAGTGYPRYHFSNRSDDILAIFAEACRRLGVACRANNRWELSVARRDSVAKLDEFVGPKS
jgi:hypothetical protein